jgi:CRISPR-associated protein Cas1
MLPNSTHSRVAARHRAQISLSEPRRKQAWRAVVQAKIRNQAVVVADSPTAGKLGELARQVRSGDVSNREAQAARAYWSAFHEKSFRRNADGDDSINGALNYGYTVLRGAMAQAVVRAGLWPTAGIHHQARENSWCLVDDLMEPFRPVVDRAVLDMEDFPSSAARQRIVAILDDKFDDTSTRIAVQESAEAFALYVEGDSEEFSAPEMAA